jgi:hypothetical protein
MPKNFECLEAKKIIINLLKLFPRPYCCELHHGKKDRHEYNESCPVEARILKAIQEAEDFVKNN